MMRIMTDNECKAYVNSLLCNRTYSFMYDIKTTELRQFLDPKMTYINNFQICTNIAIEIKLQSGNFKPKEASKVSHRYFFKRVGLYCIENIQVAQLSTLKKRQK